MTDIAETLQKYEEQFASRFTAQDEQYQKYLEQPVNTPPVVEDWRGRSGGGFQRGRDYRNQDQRGFRGRGRGWGWQEQRGQWQDRRWGSGGHHQGGQHNSYNQGYGGGGGGQRHYDRY
ncbi:RNA guanine-N7 methyltransferase activating subunit-like [Engraulis encrasicolus]|uniref:RNA guanine-N7 methyltransferase activating subunit-like n=1 Tax=Engraulis encrasicolus TaxID=184585 RepID=UPI002FD4B9A4